MCGKVSLGAKTCPQRAGRFRSERRRFPNVREGFAPSGDVSPMCGKVSLRAKTFPQCAGRFRSERKRNPRLAGRFRSERRRQIRLAGFYCFVSVMSNCLER
jgi:hypothetical protein